MNLDDWKFSPGAILSSLPTICPVGESTESDVDDALTQPDQLERVVTIRKSHAEFSSIEYCVSGDPDTSLE